MATSLKKQGKALLIGKILVIIFTAEMLIMLFLLVFKIELNGLLEALLDALTLTILTTPFLYLWVIRPFVETRDYFEQDLKTSQQHLLAAQRVARVGSWRLDHLQNHLTWSDEIYDLFCLDKNEFEVSYESFFTRVHPDDRPVVDKVLSNSIKEKTPFKIEHRQIQDDGTIIYICQRGETIYNLKGNPVTTTGTVLDITQHIESQRQIEEERKRAQNYLDIASVIMVALDRDGKVTMANPTCCKTLNITNDEMHELNWIDNFFIDSEKTQMKQVFKEVMDGKTRLPEFHENWIRALDGTLLLISWHNSIIYDDHNKIIGTLSSGIDITSQREAEQALAKSRQETEEALEKLSELSLQLQTEAAQRKQVEETVNRYSQIDYLTELPTRSVIKKQINELVNISNSNFRIVLLLIRVHGIENINRHHGLDIGDAAIVETAIRIRENSGQEELVCRSHGAEFIVAFTNLNDINHHIRLINEAIQQPLETAQSEQLKATITKSIYPDDAESLDDLFNKSSP